MRKHKDLAGALVVVAALLGGAGCSSDSPTSSSVPVISQLQIQGAQRVSGTAQGVVGISFDYADPDGDINRFVFGVAGGPLTTNPLSGAGQAAGVVGVQQAVTLPAAGTEVAFSVFVIDRRGNRSNSLGGTFVAP